MSSFLYVDLWVISPFYRNTGPIELGPLLMFSFNLNYLFKGPVFKYSHSEVLGDRTSAYEFWEDTTQPIAFTELCILPIVRINFAFSASSN